MKLASLTISGSILLLIAFTGSLGAVPDQKAKVELLALENQWLQAEDDPQALESVLADDFLHVVPVGIITKKEQLDFLRKHPAREHSVKHFEDLHVRTYGNVGIVNGAVVAAREGTIEKTLFTDVFAYRDGRWQAVNAQELPARPAH